jgi:UDPglucose 6-dehydrogenase
MPNVQKQKNYPIQYTDDQYSLLQDADALLICTEWGMFRNPDFELMKKSMKNPVIFDGRNLYENNKMRELGWTYFSIGRNPIQ